MLWRFFVRRHDKTVAVFSTSARELGNPEVCPAHNWMPEERDPLTPHAIKNCFCVRARQIPEQRSPRTQWSLIQECSKKIKKSRETVKMYDDQVSDEATAHHLSMKSGAITSLPLVTTQTKGLTTKATAEHLTTTREPSRTEKKQRRHVLSTQQTKITNS